METMPGLDAKFLYSETTHRPHAHGEGGWCPTYLPLEGRVLLRHPDRGPPGRTRPAPAVPPSGRAGPVGAGPSRVGGGPRLRPEASHQPPGTRRARRAIASSPPWWPSSQAIATGARPAPVGVVGRGGARRAAASRSWRRSTMRGRRVRRRGSAPERGARRRRRAIRGTRCGLVASRAAPERAASC